MSTVATNKPPSRAREWTRLIAITGSAQVAVQAIGFACGILVIRLLPVEEYAYFTIATSVLGAMTVLADSGVSSGVSSQGGRVWQDRRKLGAVLSTGLSLRYQFAIYSAAVCVPVLLLLLLNQGASWSTAAIVTLSLIPAFTCALSSQLYTVIAKLHQDVAPLQWTAILACLARLAISVLALFALPFSCIALLATGASELFANRRYRILAYRHVAPAQLIDDDVHRAMTSIVRRALPDAVYFTVSGQVTVLLISLFGSTASVAEVGALGRLGRVLVIANTVFALLVVPRFARLPASRTILVRRFGQSLGLLTLAAGGLWGLVWLFRSQLLLTLGAQYSGLEDELVLLTLTQCFAILANATHRLNMCRGQVAPPVVTVSSLITVQAVAIASNDLSSVSGVLWVALWPSLGSVLLQVAYMVVCLRNYPTAP